MADGPNNIDNMSDTEMRMALENLLGDPFDTYTVRHDTVVDTGMLFEFDFDCQSPAADRPQTCGGFETGGPDKLKTLIDNSNLAENTEWSSIDAADERNSNANTPLSSVPESLTLTPVLYHHTDIVNSPVTSPHVSSNTSLMTPPMTPNRWPSSDKSMKQARLLYKESRVADDDVDGSASDDENNVVAGATTTVPVATHIVTECRSTMNDQRRRRRRGQQQQRHRSISSTSSSSSSSSSGSSRSRSSSSSSSNNNNNSSNSSSSSSDDDDNNNNEHVRKTGGDCGDSDKFQNPVPLKKRAVHCNIDDLLFHESNDESESEDETVQFYDEFGINVEHGVRRSERVTRSGQHGFLNVSDVSVLYTNDEKELFRHRFVVNDFDAELEPVNVPVPPTSMSDFEVRSMQSVLLKKIKPRKPVVDKSAPLRKFIDVSRPPTMSVIDYKSIVNPDPEQYIALYEILAIVETKLNRALKIIPSKLGKMLKRVHTHSDIFPQETLPIINNNSELRYFKILYGIVPKTYVSHLEVLIGRLLDSRLEKSYDLIEDELELLLLGVWRLSAQDLRFYNERINRRHKKEVCLMLYHDLVKRSKALKSNSTEKKDELPAAMQPYEVMTKALLCFKSYMFFSNKCKIPTMALVSLKKLMMYVYMFIGDVGVQPWASVFFDFGLHSILFNHTFNHLMKNRVHIYTWFAQMINTYLETEESCTAHSVWYRCLNAEKNDYGAPDNVTTNDDDDDDDGQATKNKTKPCTIFTKKDVRSIFSKFFKKNADVPLKLLIKLDNYFMIFVHYFIQYLKDTGLVYQKHITILHITCFLKMYSHHVWPRYSAKLLDVNLREKVYTDFSECIKRQHRQYCNFENDRFVIDRSVILVLMEFAFDVLLWILGPLLLQNGKTVCIPTTTCVNLIIRHIDLFETKYVLLNKNLPCPLNYPPWLCNGTGDRDYNEFNDNVACYERGVFMFPENGSDYDSDGEDDDDDVDLIGENRNVVDLSIPAGEMTDFNDTDSETDVWDPSKDYLERNRLMQNLLKHQEEKNRIVDCEKMKARSNALELEIKRINELLSDTTCAIEKKLIVGEVKRNRLEVERMVICGEYNETLFDAGIIPGDVAKYINRTSFVKPKKRKRTLADPYKQKKPKRATPVDVVTTTVPKTSSKRNSIIMTNYKNYILNEGEDFKTVDGVRTFGLVTNASLNRKGRDKRGCNLCNMSKSGTLNVKINESYVISACVVCMEKIKNLLKTGTVSLKYIQKFLITRIDCHYKAPLLFDKHGQMFKEVTPRVELKELSMFTYNKMDEMFGKRATLRPIYDSMCEKYNWPSRFAVKKSTKTNK
ncbi:uncharacterized protein LOC113558895 [Rhopalosiphum maidis]|uniref:uncharacterized protein LOC113558895 n=1 Tax=Rhopalosiphum maidis TaxID=43146 RepID=UPI000EFE6BD4|nr:uncharacterized protein LOC113558895 [Rhopalosiphum maidis]